MRKWLHDLFFPDFAMDLETLDRYRINIGEYERWLAEFPQVAHTLKSLRLTTEGHDAINAGTPLGEETCDVPGLRVQLRRMSK